MCTTMVILIMYLHFKPMMDPRAQKIEIFNELTMQAQLYILVFFTDLTDQEFKFRSNLGLLSICLTLCNLGFHITFLFVHSIIAGKKYVQRKCFKKQQISKSQKTKATD